MESTVALPCGPRRLLIAGARRVSAPSRPDSDQPEANAAKTAFLQACERPVYPDPRVAGKGILWRGHANQGRCQPGRRAVLEETKVPSDITYSTPNGAFSQARSGLKIVDITLFFNHLTLAVFVKQYESKRERSSEKRVLVFAQEKPEILAPNFEEEEVGNDRQIDVHQTSLNIE